MRSMTLHVNYSCTNFDDVYIQKWIPAGKEIVCFNCRWEWNGSRTARTPWRQLLSPELWFHWWLKWFYSGASSDWCTASAKAWGRGVSMLSDVTAFLFLVSVLQMLLWARDKTNIRRTLTNQYLFADFKISWTTSLFMLSWSRPWFWETWVFLTVLTLSVFMLARKRQNTKMLPLTFHFFYSVCTQQMIKHPVVVDQGHSCMLRAEH